MYLLTINEMTRHILTQIDKDMHFMVSCFNRNFAPFKQIYFSFKTSRASAVCKNCLSLSMRMKCIHAFNNEDRLDLD